jgi:hypothetical protein
MCVTSKHSSSVIDFFDHCSEIFKTDEDRNHINCRSASSYVIIEKEMAADISKISSC